MFALRLLFINELKSRFFPENLRFAHASARTSALRSPLLHRKNPDCSALRYFRELSRAASVEHTLHPCWIYTPSRLHCDVLFAIDRKRCGLAGNAGIRRKLPEEFSALRVECVEISIIRSAT